MRIPHRVGPRSVGRGPAAAVLTKAPGDNNAQYESVLAFPLCRGLFATAKFSLLTPVAEYGGRPLRPVPRQGRPDRQWNHDRALAALGQVALEGYLPPGRVTARAGGRTVTGSGATAAATRWPGSRCDSSAAAPRSRGRRPPPTAATASLHRDPGTLPRRGRAHGHRQGRQRDPYRRARRDRPRRLMLLRALAGAAFLAAAAVVAALAVGGATAAPQACANSTPPTILPEPEFTLGATNVIRWEHVDQSCWDNSGADGKKSAERKFDVVVTNVANGLSEWTSVSGEDETDATISGSEFPATSSTGIEGRRFTYKIRRSELVCNAGNPQTGVCIDRRYRWALVDDGRVHTGRDSAERDASVGSGSPSRAPCRFLQSSPARAATGMDAVRDGSRAPVRTPRSAERQLCRSLQQRDAARAGARARRRAADVRTRLGRRAQTRMALRGRSSSASRRGTRHRSSGTRSSSTGPGPHSRSVTSTTQIVVGGTVDFELVAPVDGVGAPGSGVNTALARWAFGDGATAATSLTASHAYAATGTYEVTARLGDQLGNLTNSPPLRITVTAAPVPPTPGGTPASPGCFRAGHSRPHGADADPRRGLKRRGVPTNISFCASERATLLVQIRILTPRPARVVATLRKPIRAGRGGAALGRAVQRPGRYRITVAARDAAGNVSAMRVLIVRSQRR